jgi:putative phosphoesterase
VNILVISDSHREHLPVRKLLTVYAKQVGAVLHLGDHADDLLRYEKDFPDIEMLAVPGNCDYPAFDKYEVVYRAGGAKILLTHGHRQQVKGGFDRLIQYARERKADACLFGHTHEPVMVANSGILFMNPGSLGKPRHPDKPGYGLLRVSVEGAVSGVLMTLVYQDFRPKNIMRRMLYMLR